jgi:hypothetical protein
LVPPAVQKKKISYSETAEYNGLEDDPSPFSVSSDEKNIVSTDDENISSDKLLEREIAALERKLLGVKKSGFWFGVYFKSKDGDKGTGYLSETDSVIEFFTLKDSDLTSYKLYGGVKLISLYSGRPNSLTWNSVGLGQEDSNYKSSASGFAPYIGGYYKSDSGWVFEGFLSTTPITGIIEPTFTYSLSIGHKDGYYLTFYRLPVEDSLLSYVGNQVRDLKWGRVVENGLGLGIKLKAGRFGIEDKFAYAFDISGKNTIKNSAIKNTLLIYTDIRDQFDFFANFEHALVGPIFIYQSYRENTNFYTFGHGGYFSPQNFALMGIFWDLKRVFSPESILKFTGNIGYLTFTEESAPKYPFGNSDERYEANSSSSLGYSMKLIYTRKLTGRIWLNLFAGLDKSSDYVLFDAGIRLNYYFSESREFLNLEERALGRFSTFRDLYTPID